jgi:predicted dinucleotide-binding enzyme
MRLIQRELPAVQPADLAVLLVRAEGRIGVAQRVEHLLENALVDIVVADVDDDRHAHDVLNRDQQAQTFFSSTSARWRDWMYA